MKILMSFLMLFSLVQISGCNRSDVGDDDEVTIERQEDYNREDASDTEIIPIHRDDELKLQNDDEVDVDD
jgi:hypothetical protein